jgi:hypothetical protein
VADLNDGMSEDAGWPVLEAARVSSDAKVDQLTSDPRRPRRHPKRVPALGWDFSRSLGVDNAV